MGVKYKIINLNIVNEVSESFECSIAGEVCRLGGRNWKKLEFPSKSKQRH